jgi:hypothetical protein
MALAKRYLLIAGVTIAMLVLAPPLYGGAAARKALVSLRGTVVAIGPREPASGIIASYRLAKLKVDAVCRGHYTGDEMVVDCLVLVGNELDTLVVGEKVFVTVEPRRKLLSRFNVPGFRDVSDTVPMY